MQRRSGAADLSQADDLVAIVDPRRLSYERTSLTATPLGDGGHIGFIINKPIGP